MNINKMNKIAASIFASILLAAPASATSIDLSYDVNEFNTVQGQLALSGFEQAANFWSGLFSDDITVNLDISFAALEQGVIGSTRSNRAVYFYNHVASAMINDASSLNDIQAANSLTCEAQGGDSGSLCSRSFLDTEADTNNPGLDNDGSGDNFVLALTQANAKALGFTGNSWNDPFEASDASIQFSSAFAFDFDSSDGIDNDKMDFVGVAIHEIGHALGFTSGIDTYDWAYYRNNPAIDLDPYAVANSLDLFRYSTESLAAGVGTLDFRPGAESYFSLDSGLTNLAYFSTGRSGGDGQQASHWKDNEGIGIMDPTFSFGEFGQISELDTVAFDVMGWDLTSVTDVPEPTSIALFGLSAMGLFATRRRKSAVLK